MLSRRLCITTCLKHAGHARFQHHLEAVLEAADDFHEIPDIIARHAMLEAVQHDLRRQQQAATEDTETAKHAPLQLEFGTLRV